MSKHIKKISISARFQRGMNLVELMIAMALGLVVVAGAGQIFLSNTQAFRLQDSVSNMQQSSQLVMEMILADIRRAGLDMGTASYVPAGVAGGFAGKHRFTNSATTPGLLLSSDEMTISYVASEATTDCEGNNAAVGATVVNRYFVRMDGNPNIPALVCAGAVNALPSTAANAGTALLRGVEAFKVLYGIAQAAGNGFVGPSFYTYGSTGEIPSIQGAYGANPLVGAVQIGLVVRTEEGVQGVQPPAAAIDIFRLPMNPASEPGVISAASLAAVRVNNMVPIHRVFTGLAAVRNPATITFVP